MAGVIVPTARALYLCEGVHAQDGIANLYGVFNGLQADRFPHRQEELVCFAQLRGGLGEVPFHIDIVRAADMRTVTWSGVERVRFSDREAVVQVVYWFEEVEFTVPGLYFVELYCDNELVTDTTLLLWADE